MANLSDDQFNELYKKHTLYDKVFNSPDGKEIINDLKLRCFHNKSCFSSDPIRMAYNEGKRDAYLHLVNMSDLETISKLEQRLSKTKKKG